MVLDDFAERRPPDDAASDARSAVLIPGLPVTVADPTKGRVHTARG